MRFLGVLCLALTFVVACGDGKKSEDTPIAHQDFQKLSPDLQDYIEAMCAYEQRCWGGDLTFCLDWLVPQVCGPAFDMLEIPGIEACVSALSALDCKGDHYQLPACLPARRAQYEARGSALVSLGESCSEGEGVYCDQGLFCDAMDFLQCGQCEKVRALGEACTVGRYDQCAPNAYCDAKGVCTETKPEGAACSEFSECGGATLCVNGKCAPFESIEGRACETSKECGDQLPCRGGKCVARSPVGAACSESIDCETLVCAQGKCGEQATCGRGKEGNGCFWDSDCGEGLVCAWQSSQCEKPLADGQTGCSTGDRQCSTTSYCKYDEARALEHPDDPDAAYVCAPREVNGKGCELPGRTDQCVSGYCTAELECGERPADVCE